MTTESDLLTENSSNPQPIDLVANLGYGEALDELEGILVELESNMVDVDTLADKVRRAAALVAHCRSRLTEVRTDVANIVTGLDTEGSLSDV